MRIVPQKNYSNLTFLSLILVFFFFFNKNQLNARSEFSETASINGKFTLQIATTIFRATDLNTPDGSINVTPSGGTAPYNLKLLNANGNTIFDNTIAAGLTTINNLAAGMYQVILTDGTTASTNKNILIGVINCDLMANIPNVTVNCSDSKGNLTPVVSGGSMPYTYAWNNGSTTPTLTNVDPATYILTVTDKLGCMKTATGTINAPNALVIFTNPSNTTNPTATDGSVQVLGSGGTMPYTLQLTNPSGNIIYNNTLNAGLNTISGLSFGTYQAVLTDAKGCTVNKSFTIGVQNCTLMATLNGKNLNCGNDVTDLTVEVTGQTGTIQYLWNTGATTPTLSNIGVGTYTVSVTDATGTACQVVKTASITANSATINANFTIVNKASDPTQTDGIVQLDITGGMNPFTLNISSVTGAAVISNTIIGNSANLQNFPPGQFNYTIQDNNNCTVMGTFQVGVVNCLLGVTIPDVTSVCGGNNAVLTPQLTNSIAPITYQWSNGATTTVLSGVASGTYGLTVTDATGCQASSSGKLTILSGPELTCTKLKEPKNNLGLGIVRFKISGNKTPLTLKIEKPTGNQFFVFNAASTKDVALPIGKYKAILTDMDACATSCNFEISIDQGNNGNGSGNQKEICDGKDNDGDGQIDEGFDRDGDGVADCSDPCPDDPKKVDPGFCGCGNVEVGDRDGDGQPDCIDECPSNPYKSIAGNCGCEAPDITRIEIGNKRKCSNNGTTTKTDDTFLADVRVYFDWPPELGALVLRGATDAYYHFQNGNTVNFITLNALTFKADGKPIELIAEFKGNEDCHFKYKGAKAELSCSQNVCDKPADIAVSVKANRATFSWKKGANAASYEYKYRPIGAKKWTAQWTDQNLCEICDLKKGTQYEYAIRSLCENNYSSPYETGIFETENYKEACVPTTATDACIITDARVINIRKCHDKGTIFQSDDFFYADILVYYQNPPRSGNLNITGNVDLSVPIASLGSQLVHHIEKVKIFENKGKLALDVAFSEQPNCTFSTIFKIPRNPCYDGSLKPFDYNRGRATSSNEVNKDNGRIIIAPNPVKDVLMVKYQFKHPKAKTQIQIYNFIGQKELHQEVEGGAGQLTLGIQDLENGIYYLNINNGGVSITKKFIKESLR
jgi:hypothetical protein